MKKDRFFFLKNLGKGLIWFAVILIVFIVVKKFGGVDFIEWLAPVYNNPFLVFLIYILSEIIIGIIPPELFIIWALRNGQMTEFIGIVILLSIISYCAGIIGYFIGRYLSTTRLFRLFRRRVLKRSEKLLHIYGIYLIIVAALTPVPFSGVSMLVGTVRYPFKKYLLYSSTRFIKFSLNAWIIWEASMI